jgi:hypothetical protein
MTRRMRSLAEMEVLAVAELAAKAEKADASSIDALIRGGYLPEGFGLRLKGVGARTIDTLRGARGSFLPVSDVAIGKVTREELEAYVKFAGDYRRQWEWMDPALIGIGRQVIEEDKRERITADLYVYPYARRNYSLLRLALGDPTTTSMAPIPGDLISASARGKMYIEGFAFAGFQDAKVSYSIRAGKMIELDPDVDAYWGGVKPTKNLGFNHDDLTFDEQGISRGQYNNWYLKHPTFDVGGSSREVLLKVGPKLSLRPAKRPAALRVRINDPEKAKVTAMLHAAGYLHARKASQGNASFLDALTYQLQVPDKEALDTAARLLGGRLACPLGGDYEWRSTGRWGSNVWRDWDLENVDSVPEGYRFPFLEWFHGGLLEFSITDTTLTTHLELVVQPGVKAHRPKKATE